MVLALHNLSGSSQTVEVPHTDGRAGWADLLSGGDIAGGLPRELRAYEVLWLRSE
jgi:hypothetical protein